MKQIVSAFQSCFRVFNTCEIKLKQDTREMKHIFISVLFQCYFHVVWAALGCHLRRMFVTVCWVRVDKSTCLRLTNRNDSTIGHRRTCAAICRMTLHLGKSPPSVIIMAMLKQHWVDTLTALCRDVPRVADDTGLTFTQLSNTLYESGSRVIGSLLTAPCRCRRLCRSTFWKITN